MWSLKILRLLLKAHERFSCSDERLGCAYAGRYVHDGPVEKYKNILCHARYQVHVLRRLHCEEDVRPYSLNFLEKTS